MNTKHISLAFAAVVTLLAGCAKSPIEETTNAGGLTDLELAYVGSTEVKSAIDGTDFPQTGEIGLFLFTDEAATTPYGETGYINVKYAYNSTKGKWTASPSIKVGSTPGYLYGYYPYSSEAESIKAIPVASSLDGDDVMYASKQNSPITDQTASQTAITMNHALARVSITVKNNGYIGNAKLTSIKFAGAKTSETGTLDATTGTISGTTKADVTLAVPEGSQTITATGTTYECLLVPSEKDETKQEVTLTLKIDGQDKTATLSGENGVIFAQGTKSTIAITLSDSGISVQTVSVKDWNVVEVGGYKVTVKEATDVTTGDILSKTYVDGNTVKILAFSQFDKGLVCNVTGSASSGNTKTDNIYTFTISDITSDVTATIGYQPVESIALDRTSVDPALGWVVSLSAEVSPEYAGNKTVTWSSSNEAIATVDANGNVTAVAQGEATITATAADGSGVTATCVVTVGPAIAGSLSHEFSVSATKKIHFSQGNLRATYNGTNYIWSFASNQYDCIGNAAGNTTIENQTSGAVVDLFGWSTANTNYGISTSTSNDDYSGDFVDWGKNIDGGNTWRTLSKDEWMYLSITRKVNGGTGEGKSFSTKITYGGKSGLLLYHDNYTGPALSGVVDTLPEGTVFLPNADHRNGNNVSKDGFYWTSSSDGTNSAYNYTGSSHDRYYGFSVRLVTDVK